MKDHLEKVENYLREILPVEGQRCLRPREGPYHDRRFYPKRTSWLVGQLWVDGIENGQLVAFSLLCLYEDWIQV